MTELQLLRHRLAKLERLVLGDNEPVVPQQVTDEEPPREHFLMFAERQGCDFVTANNRHLFANGAQSNEFFHWEPPTDPEALAELRYEYLRVKSANVTKRYDADRSAIIEQARIHAMGAGPLPAPGWEEHLRQLAQEIERLDGERAEIAATLRRHQRAQERNAYLAQRQADADGVLAKMQQLPTY